MRHSRTFEPALLPGQAAGAEIAGADLQDAVRTLALLQGGVTPAPRSNPAPGEAVRLAKAAICTPRTCSPAALGPAGAPPLGPSPFFGSPRSGTAYKRGRTPFICTPLLGSPEGSNPRFGDSCPSLPWVPAAAQGSGLLQYARVRTASSGLPPRYLWRGRWPGLAQRGFERHGAHRPGPHSFRPAGYPGRAGYQGPARYLTRTDTRQLTSRFARVWRLTSMSNREDHTNWRVPARGAGTGSAAWERMRRDLAGAAERSA